MTSVEIKLLVSLAAVGAVYVFIRNIQHSGRRRRLAVWLRDHYPEEWRKIGWGHRNLFLAGALLRLHQSGAVTHAHFHAEYPKVRRWPRDMLVAFLASCAAMALAIVGGEHFGWRW